MTSTTSRPSNDSLGHCIGDAVLVDVAERLQGAVRPMDTVARLGGDEFVVLVEDPQPGAAIGTAKRVVEALHLPALVAGHTIVLQASAGVALGEIGEDPDRLLANADAAMYAAKARGKGHWEVFEPEMHRAVLNRLELTVDLARAVERDELFVVYQPIVDLATGRAVGAEALVRWNHPTRGLVPPLDFISIAEDSGQIARWGRTCSTRRSSSWRAVMSTTSRSTSPSRVAGAVPSPRLRGAGRLGPRGGRSRSEPSHPEVTETGIMTDVEDNISTPTALRHTGVRIASTTSAPATRRSPTSSAFPSTS